MRRLGSADQQQTVANTVTNFRDFTKDGQFLHRLRDYYLLKTHSALWSQLLISLAFAKTSREIGSSDSFSEPDP